MQHELNRHTARADLEELKEKQAQRILMHNKNVERYKEQHQELMDEQTTIQAKIQKLDEEIELFTKQFEELEPKWDQQQEQIVQKIYDIHEAKLKSQEEVDERKRQEAEESRREEQRKRKLRIERYEAKKKKEAEEKAKEEAELEEIRSLKRSINKYFPEKDSQSMDKLEPVVEKDEE
jgi:chromosome segregation ATPase